MNDVITPIHPLNSNRKNTLTEDQVQAINDVVESAQQSKETEMIRDITNNPEVVEVERKGYTKAVEVSYNAETETTVSNTNIEEKLVSDMTDEEFDEYIENAKVPELNYEIKPEDIKSHPESMYGNFDDLSDDTIIELVKLVNSHKDGVEIKFKDLPEEIQEKLHTYLSTVGGIGRDNFSVQANTTRNTLANSLMEEYFRTIDLEKYVNEYNYQVEHLFDTTQQELSPVFKMYNESNINYFTKLKEDTEDPEKKELAQNILDAISDAFNLTRLMEAAPHIKLKKFEVEKPKRVLDRIHSKYSDPKYHIYNLYGCALTLAKHLYNDGVVKYSKEARDTAVEIMLIFCKVCQNYDPKNPPEHSFMYYFTYNIFLLDIYKGEQYDEYTQLYYQNIRKLVLLIKR